MSYQTACMTDVAEPDTADSVDSMDSWVYEVLEPDQLTAAKMSYGPRKLSRGTLVLLWALRGYVVFMAVIIGLAVWNALHVAG
jgi:hypothetical protein